MVFTSCQQNTQKSESKIHQTSEKNKLEYAKTFTIENYEDYYIVNIIEPWPGADRTFNYLFYTKHADYPSNLDVDKR
jgi:iron complex transport system substrate-binding protein